MEEKAFLANLNLFHVLHFWNTQDNIQKKTYD